MDIKKPRSVIIPPYWVPLLLATVCFALVYWSSTTMTYFHPRTISALCACLFIGCYSTVKGLSYYAIRATGIMIFFALIPIRWITWDRVSNALYIREWIADGRGTIKTKGHGIVVTLLDCELFDPAVDSLTMYLIKHPFRAFFIRFAPEKKERYLETFQEYCCLSFQSDPAE